MCLQEAGAISLKGEGLETEHTLWWLGGQVRDESGDGADVGNNAEDDGDDGEPKSVTRCLVCCLDVTLRPCFVRLAKQKVRVRLNISASVRYLATCMMNSSLSTRLD